jgi:signal transduction histidine kinase
MQSILSEMQQYAENKEVVLSANIDKPLMTITDPVLAKEVFANLLSNAIKYTPQGGTVHVSLKPKDNTVVCSVKDTGLGIPDHVQDRIFTKFFRAPNVLQKETSGTGLGLYMVKSIADNLGGKIWFKSVEGKGSTFYFSLPIISAPKQNAV